MPGKKITAEQIVAKFERGRGVARPGTQLLAGGLATHSNVGEDRAVTLPPKEIDGATILRVADLTGAVPTGRTRHVVNGEDAAGFAALAIAKYDSDPGFYLFYCDGEWRVVTDTYHDTVEAAITQAEFEYGALTFEEPPR